jgi:DNA-binding NtrC family response regulator
MGPLQPPNENGVIPMRRESVENLPPVLETPTILVATVDAEIKESMRGLLDLYPLKTVWAKSVDEVRAALAKETVSACFCGFWLIDGTYRDVVRHLKKQPIEIPAVIVCAPACPNEYRDYLAALNIRAFDFICHPYRKTDMERILQAAFSARNALHRFQTFPSDAVLAPDGESNLRKAG